MTAPSPPNGPGLEADPQAALAATVELAEAALVRSTRKAKRDVLAANYGGSSVAVFPIQADGSLGAASQVIPHFGDFGPNAGRQEAPHPHMCLPDSTGKFVLVNDLGLDEEAHSFNFSHYFSTLWLRRNGYRRDGRI